MCIRDRLRRRERRAGQLLLDHVHVVFVDVRIADEVAEPARRVAGQPADQMHQRRAFGQVERRAQTQVVRAHVEAHRQLARGRIRDELIQQVAGRQGDRVEHRRIPAVEQDAAAARIVDDGVEAFAQLVDRFVQQHLGHAVVVELGDQAEAVFLGVGDLGWLIEFDQLEARPLAPLHAVDRANMVLPANLLFNTLCVMVHFYFVR